MQHAAPGKRSNRLTAYHRLGVVLGIVVGFVCNQLAGDPAEAKAIASNFTVVTDIFLRLIKMIIAPLVFATMVSGIASMGDAKAVGRIAFKAMGWFVLASLVSLALGLIMANLLQPGAGLALPLPDAAAATGLEDRLAQLPGLHHPGLPDERVSGDGRQQDPADPRLLDLLRLRRRVAHGQQSPTVLVGWSKLAHGMFKVTDYVMRVAPFGVFAAMAAVVTIQGLGVLVTYGKFIGAFYLGLGAAVGGADRRRAAGSSEASVCALLKLLREPMHARVLHRQQRGRLPEDHGDSSTSSACTSG